jgi:hypothetical protein
MMDKTIIPRRELKLKFEGKRPTVCDDPEQDGTITYWKMSRKEKKLKIEDRGGRRKWRILFFHRLQGTHNTETTPKGADGDDSEVITFLLFKCKKSNARI